MNRKSKAKPREHDFSRGVRGKHVARLKSGHKTVVTKADGSVDRYTTRPVILERDVQSVFKDSRAVNKALRGLIANSSERVES